MERRNQEWILSNLLRVGGLDVLHPDSPAMFEMMGYDHADYVRVASQVRSGAMIPKAWSLVAQQVEYKAQYYEEQGYDVAALNLFQRAAQMYSRAQYAIYRDDPVKTLYHGKMGQCYDKVIQYGPSPIERIQIPFEGKIIYALLHLPRAAAKAPCVILVPGMDMVKENWHQIAQQYFVSQGMAALAMDGPGQGESLLHNLKVTVDNYERAAKAVIDYIYTDRRLDAEKVGVFGLSMGTYWGTRIAAYDRRIKACATAMGCYGTTEVIFEQAQPNFKKNFMFMSGISDEAEFDEKIGHKMHLRDMAPKVRCPYLMIHGEFDELCPLQDALQTFDLVPVPKELWVFEDEFHPLAGVANEMVTGAVDWLQHMLKGDYSPKMDRRVFIARNGTYHEGSALPLWWSGLPTWQPRK